MGLTSQQTGFFETFGYLKVPSLFSKEIGNIAQEFEEALEDRDRSQKKMPQAFQFIDENKYLCDLLDDPRIESIGGSLLGHDFNYTSSEGNLYSGDTHWHSDHNVDKKYLSVKIALYLDPVSSGTGCLQVIPGSLQVIPGSHMVGDQFAEALSRGILGKGVDCVPEDVDILATDVPSVALETKPGDLLVFNHKIKHASFGGGNRRRQLALNLQERYLDEDLWSLREKISHLAKFGHQSADGELIVITANKARMVHLEQRLANDDHLPSLVMEDQGNIGGTDS